MTMGLKHARNERNVTDSEEEWEAYACRIPRPGERSSFDRWVCWTLTEVFHVAHVADACRIIEDGRIKAGLIGDESRLRRSRTSVSWLSANYWAPGSMYGTVEFTFRWEDIIAERHVYWVEAMRDYRPPAYRFLITDRDLSASNLIQPYDPETTRGPLRLRDGIWYWNGKYTSEFMVDADLPLRRCVEIKTITHRRDLCRLHPSRCAEADSTTSSTGAQTLAYVLARNLTSVRRCIMHRSEHGIDHPLSTLRDTLGHLLHELTEDEPHGPITSARASEAAMKGALLLYGAGQFDDAQEVARTLGSRAVAETALLAHAREYLGLPEFSLRPPQRRRA
jgi:hypothetical protein